MSMTLRRVEQRSTKVITSVLLGIVRQGAGTRREFFAPAGATGRA
jgi:GTP cyclohydrolase I